MGAIREHSSPGARRLLSFLSITKGRFEDEESADVRPIYPGTPACQDWRPLQDRRSLLFAGHYAVNDAGTRSIAINGLQWAL